MKEFGIIRIGTCSWTEKSLVESGAFYPRNITTPHDRLKFYATHFDTVEVDSSYYSIPTLQMAQAWSDRTPEKFLFHVKAYGALTGHSVNPQFLPEELRELLPPADWNEDSVHVSDPSILREMARAMVTALQPLRDAHKLGFIIFQFPPWFTCKKANREYILYCKEMMEGLPIAVEFRHGSWLTQQHAPEVFTFLREHKITYITCDEPQYGDLSTAPFRPEVTTSMAYLRLHGRDTESWANRADPRYGYLYRKEDLDALALVALRLSARTRMVFVMFNNSHGGNAIRNALEMKAMLEGRGTFI